ncbi:MAG TPA: hypothetical protein VIM57_09020 [Luteolibacter sp.]
MRAVLCIIGVWIAPLSVRAEEVILLRHYLGGKDRVEFGVPRAELEKIPDWQPRAGRPAPLTRNQALEIAKKAAASEKLEVSDLSKLVVSLEQTNRFEEDLIRGLPPTGCRWFYVVEFKGGDIALKGKYTFLVTMSGAVATKVIQ